MSNYNPFQLDNKTIFITGASSGIGRSTAIECSKLGAKLIITGRNKERLNETLKLLEGVGHSLIISDLSDHTQIVDLVSQLPPIDGFVNCSGIVKPLVVKYIEPTILSDIFNINTFAPIMMTQQLSFQKKIKNGCSLVFISSILGTTCSQYGESVYSASKGAINGFVKGAALEFSSRGARVNTINPGMITTGFLDNSSVSEEQLLDDIKKYPLKRYGKPEEVAFSVIYLLSDVSAWVTGTNLLIDGGFTLL